MHKNLPKNCSKMRKPYPCHLPTVSSANLENEGDFENKECKFESKFAIFVA